jgi:hypothetical protein
MLRQVIDEIEQLHRAIASRGTRLSAARFYKSSDASGDRQLRAVNSLITSRVLERRGRVLMPYFSALLKKSHRRGDLATPVAILPRPSASRKRSRV